MGQTNEFNTYGFDGIRADRRESDNNHWAYIKRLKSGEDYISYEGKGPKGYVRKDEKIKEDVCDALYEDIWVDASDIEVSVDQGVVRLEGKVADRVQKKEAEACIENIQGVKDVLNLLILKEDHGLIGEANINLNMI